MKLKSAIGFTLGLLSLLTLGCQQNQDRKIMQPDDTLISVSVDDASQDDIIYQGTVFIGDAGDRFGTDEYELNSATITDDTLNVSVSYSGGCKEHEFTLVASEAFLESDPVQLSVSIAHNANGDTCEAYPTDNYRFDLTPIKKMYQKAYQQEAGTIILRLKDAPDGELVYEFAM